MYVLKCSDSKRGYVAKPGSSHSYTRRLEGARTFPSRADAEREKCGNEVVLLLEDLIR